MYKRGLTDTLNIVDFHIHILPETDDGACDLNESLKMARLLCELGIYEAVATPHYISEKDTKGFLEKLRAKLAYLERELAQNNIPLKLYLGCEVRTSAELLYLENIKALTIQNSDCILIEFPFLKPFDAAEELLYTFKIRKIKAVLAHPERCEYFFKNIKDLEELNKQGVRMQCNVGSFLGLYGHHAKHTAFRMLSLGLVHLLGTDAHSAMAAEIIKRNVKKLKAVFSEELISTLNQNSRNILEPGLSTRRLYT